MNSLKYVCALEADDAGKPHTHIYVVHMYI